MLGDKCYKCGKRANPKLPLDEQRWHHCPRCGITFNVKNKTLQQIKDESEGKKLADKFKK